MNNPVFASLAGAVGSIAPALATALGGPLAGTAVAALAQAFGLTPGATAEDITRVVQAGGMTPDIVAKVREADQRHAEVMSQQQIDVRKLNQDFVANLVQADVADRKSAREREEAVKDHTPAALAWLIVGANVALIAGVALGYVRPTDQLTAGLVGANLGYLASESKAVLAYYFGSSAGSQAKDATIDKALNS